MISNIFGNFLLFFVFMIGFLFGVASATAVIKAVLNTLAKVFDPPLQGRKE